MKTKKIIIIAVCALLTVGVVSALVFTGIGNMPHNLFIRSVSGFFSDSAERDELKIITKAISGGSIEVEAPNLGNDDLLGKGHIFGKIHFSKNAVAIEDFDFKYKDTELCGKAYFSDKLLYVKEDTVLGGAYGAKMSSVAYDLSKSIFAYGSGSEYAMKNRVEYNDLLAYAKYIGDKDFHRDTQKIVELYSEQIYDIFLTHVTFEKGTEEMTSSDDKQKVRSITVTITPEEQISIVRDIYDFLLEEDEIYDYIDEYSDILKRFLLDYVSRESNLTEKYKTFLNDLGNDLDELYSEIKWEKKNIDIKLLTPKFSSTLLALSIKYGEDSVLSIDAGKDGVKKADQIAIRSNDSSIFYRVAIGEDESRSYILTIDGETVLRLTTYDNDEKFDLDLGKTKIEGSYKNKIGKLIFNIKKITVTKELQYGSDRTKKYNSNITVTVDKSDSIPISIRRYERLTDITDEDVDGWIEKFEGE